VKIGEVLRYSKNEAKGLHLQEPFKIEKASPSGGAYEIPHKGNHGMEHSGDEYSIKAEERLT